MGKEAKIGLSIIGILVIIFAVVLGQRMLGSKDESKIAKDGKKASQSKKETDKKPDDPKKSRLELFETSKKKKPKTVKPGSEGKATSALVVSQRSHGTSGASDSSADIWSLNRNKPTTASSSLMPKPTGSTTLESHQERGSQRLGSSNIYSRNYASPSGSRAAAPTPGAAVLGSPPQSPYTTPSPYKKPGGASGSRYASGYNEPYRSKAHSHDPGHAASSRQPADSRYAASSVYGSSGSGNSNGYRRAPVGPRTGGARLDTPKPYEHAGSSGYGSDSSHRGSSRYRSASYDSSGYGASRSSGSSYSGGAQSDGTYIVKPHQNYWAISKDVYGTGAYFKALAEANRGSIPDENRLKVGDRIKTPDLAELEQTYPELCPAPERRDIMRKRAEMASTSPHYGGSGRQYIVQSGDTLYDIARYELGDAARWTEIYELNRQTLQDSFDYLTPGLKLTMPSKDGKSSTLESTYDSSSKYGGNQPQHRTEAPRTATRPSYGSSSAAPRPAPASSYNASGYSTPNYGGSRISGSRSSGSSYDSSPYQPSRSTYPRY